MQNMKKYKNMLNNKNSEFAIIDNFEHIKNKKAYDDMLKYAFYSLINSSKKYNYDLSYMKYTGGCEICSHKSMAKSLLRGFCKLGVPYSFNKIAPSTKYLILLYVDDDDLETVKKLKEEGKIQKVFTTSTAGLYSSMKQEYLFAKKSFIDYASVGHEWCKKLYKEHLSDDEYEKLVVWSSGVDYQGIRNDSIKKRALVYYKKVPPFSPIESLLEKYNIDYKSIIYGEYEHSDFIKEIQNSDFVIFNQTGYQSHSLAQAEVWAQNKPILIQYSDEFQNGGSTSPYLTEKSGRYYKDMSELDNILAEYNNNPKEFLSSFAPADYVANNFTDEISVKKLIDLLTL